ncbi:MAG: amidohydrolase family protein, partial [Pseudomonadales bacterium]|nr:amidohydrolase family protein [Pseudomonadales bacterium]
LKGIRHSVARDTHFPDGIVIRPAPANLLTNPDYRAGLEQLTNADLVYEAMVYHQQIPELRSLARDMPNLKIVLNHYGCLIGVGPYRGKEAETLKRWRADMQALAKCPNVVVKLGGLGMIVCGARWHEAPEPPSSEALASAWQPYFDVCLAEFGAERCMFESNFPVDKAMYSYAVYWNACKRLCAPLPKRERDALFHLTATQTYQLAPMN